MTGFNSRFVGREQGSRRIGYALLVAAWTVLAWPWLSGAVTLPWDAKAQFLPQLQFLAASLAKGDSPFWAPNVFAGMPQIADPQSLIFSPPYFLLAAFNAAPSAWAADVTLYLLLLASAAALYQWLLDKGWHAAACLLAALGFAFGAAMAWRIQHIGQVMSLAYLPITLLLLDRALDRRAIGYGIGAGVAAGLLVLGRDQVALLSVYFLAGYVLVRWLSSPVRRQAPRDALAPLAAATLAGLAVVALPVLMTALVAADSNRPSIDLEGAGRGSLHPALLLTLLSPDIFGATGRMSEYWGPPSYRWSGTGLFLAQNMGQMYLGALPAVLLAWGAATGVLWQPAIRAITIALLISLFYALGWYTPAFQIFYAALPGVDLYRRPADAVFQIGFFASVLAGYVLNGILSNPAPHLQRWQKITPAALLAGAFLLMLCLAVSFGMEAQALPQIVVPAAITIAAAALLYAMSGRPVPAATAICVVAAFMTLDLAYSNAPGGATGLPPSEYASLDPATDNQTLATLKRLTAQSQSETRRDRVEIAGFGFHWPNTPLTHGLESTLGYNPLRLGAYTRATGAGDTVGLPEQRVFAPLFPSYRSRLADLLGLRYIASSVPIDQIDKNLQPGDVRLTATTADGFIYENPRALPRAMFATESVSGNFEHMITSGLWPTGSGDQAIVLEQPADRGDRRPGSVAISHYSNTKIILDVASPDGGYAVLNDIWQPWWRATLNGEDIAILRANVLFRAIAVPPGRHTITMTFEPVRGALAELLSRQAIGSR